MTKQIRIATSPLGNAIYAGTLLKGGMTANKQDVTIEALVAVAMYCIAFGKPVEISCADGTVEFTLTANKGKA